MNEKTIGPVTSLLAGSLCVLALGCGKPDGAPSASSSAAPPGSASAAPATAAAGDGCPTGSAGTGTVQEPCKPSDAGARAVEIRFTGDPSGEKRTFEFVNKTGLGIGHLDMKVYFYDKDGKQLEVTGLVAMEDQKFSHWWTSGMIFGLDQSLDANAKREAEPPGLKKEYFPKGTATVEAEADGVGFTPCGGGKPCRLYWKNAALGAETRAKQSS